MCNPESSCVDTREDVHSLKVIMQGHGFTSCEQMSLNSLQSCHFLSLILGIVSHSCNLSAQETWEGGLDQESTTRLDCKRIYPQKILEPHPECCHCHFCVRAADLGNQAAPSSSQPSSPPSLLVSVSFYFVFLQAWGSFPLPCVLRAQALLSCISSIHSVFIMCFPNKVLRANGWKIMSNFMCIPCHQKKSATVTGDVSLAIAWANIWPFSYIFYLKLFFETGSHCVNLPSLELRDLCVCLCLLSAETEGIDHLTQLHGSLKDLQPEAHVPAHLALRKWRQESWKFKTVWATKIVSKKKKWNELLEKNSNKWHV